MVGILLLTHAPLGQAFIAAVAHVFRGPTERFEAIDVAADEDTRAVNCKAKEAIARLDDGDGVLVITDIKGGTPSNCCNSLHDAGHVEVIAGISLPMLLRASPTAATRSTWWWKWRWRAPRTARCGSITASASVPNMMSSV